VLTRSGFEHPGVRTVANLDEIDVNADDRDVFICGGGQVYALALPHCSDLYLTHVKRVVEGDVFFPPFEHLFDAGTEVRDTPEFRIMHYRRVA
jgi:dihydrofolate reductase